MTGFIKVARLFLEDAITSFDSMALKEVKHRLLFKHQLTNTTSLLIGGIALALLMVGKIFLKHKPVALFVVIGGIIAASSS
jgi:hypothetical protein